MPIMLSTIYGYSLHANNRANVIYKSCNWNNTKHCAVKRHFVQHSYPMDDNSQWRKLLN